MVEAQAGIEGQLIGQLPFVLDVGADVPAEQRGLIGDGKRRSGHRADIAGQDGRDVADVGLLAAHREAGAQRVAVVDDVGAVELRAGQRALPDHVGGDVVEHQVAEDVGNEVDLGVAREEGELRVAVGAVLLQ